jgi:hypothetical protein
LNQYRPWSQPVGVRRAAERLATDALDYLLPVALNRPGESGLPKLVEITRSPFELLQRQCRRLSVPLNLAVQVCLTRVHRTSPSTRWRFFGSIPLPRTTHENRRTLGVHVRQDVLVPNEGHGDLFRARPTPDGRGFEVVFHDARTGEERVLGVVDGYAQAQSFISGAKAAIEASGAYARGYEAGLALKRESPG